jgi:hypothetical protein
MGVGSAHGSPARWLAGLAAVVALWWFALEQGERIPVLTYVNFGINELAHMSTHGASDLFNALAGSIAQVAVPLLLAVYFFFRRGDWVGAGVCLAWAAASASEVALYVADAPTQELDLIAGDNDWAFILGPDGYGAMDKSGSLADTIRDGAAVAALAGFILCLIAPLRSAQRGGRAATRRDTADSSAWAASATSGSAPRSASRPK